MIANNKNYTLITENDNSATVVENYIPIEKRIKTFQTEEALENEFIKQLQNQAYEYVQIKNEHDLIANLRKQIEKLNSYQFTDNE
jgi:type I restriction enzyme R subunit